jgi:peptidoglycan/xylan/chitin deacetylase (PgdA/CDA1 family)
MKILLILMISFSAYGHNYHVDKSIKELVYESVGHHGVVNEKVQPHELLDFIISKNITSQSFCNILKDLSDEELSVFENTVHEERFNVVYVYCRKKLVQRLDKYWDKQVANSFYINSRSKIVTRFKRTREVVIDTKANSYFGPASFPLRNKEFILTFDDGPFKHTTNILSVLERYNAKALFFHVGDQVRYKPQITVDVSRDKHMLGSHSYTHKNMPSLGTSGAIRDIAKGHQVMFDNLGYVEPFFRFPGGSRSSGIIAQLKRRSIASFHWDIDTKDYSSKTTVDQIVNRVLSGLRSKGKGIVLLHELRRSTWLALPIILEKLSQEGYTPVIPVPRNKQLRGSDPF